MDKLHTHPGKTHLVVKGGREETARRKVGRQRLKANIHSRKQLLKCPNLLLGTVNQVPLMREC